MPPSGPPAGGGVLMVAAAARFVPSSLRIDAFLVTDDGLVIRTASVSTDVCCPLCGERAERVHRRPIRPLADLPWAGVAIHLRVQIRTFFCDTPACPRRIWK